MNIVKLGNSLPVAIVIALAGLGLFLITIKFLSNSLKGVSNKTFKKLLISFSDNPLYGLLFGIIFTTIIQSSDGAIALVMGLLAARLLKLRGAIAFLLGANIGTATTSIIVAMSSGFAFTDYFVIAAFIGAIIYVIARRDKFLTVGLVTFSLGAIFLGLKLLGAGTKVITAQPFFEHFIESVTFNPWLATFVSTIFTGVFQSSSATVAIYQNIYANPDSGLMLSSAIGLIVGANIGTTFTGAIVAVLSKNKDAKRIAFLWGFINTFMAIIILIFIVPFSHVVQKIIPDNFSPGNTKFNFNAFQLSIAHLLFNSFIVVFFFFLIAHLERLSKWIIRPSKKSYDYEISLPINLLNAGPDLAYLAAEKGTKTLAKMSDESFNILKSYLSIPKTKKVDEMDNIYNYINDIRSNIKKYVVNMGVKDTTQKNSLKHINLILISRSIEKIALSNKEIIHEIKKYQSKNYLKINTFKTKNIISLLNKCQTLLDDTIKQISNYDIKKCNELKQINHSLDININNLIESNLKRQLKSDQNSGNVEVELDFDFYNILKLIENINDHILKINNCLESNSRNKTTEVKNINYKINIK